VLEALEERSEKQINISDVNHDMEVTMGRSGLTSKVTLHPKPRAQH
jgi:hypothetical protein